MSGVDAVELRDLIPRPPTLKRQSVRSCRCSAGRASRCCRRPTLPFQSGFRAEPAPREEQAVTQVLVPLPARRVTVHAADPARELEHVPPGSEQTLRIFGEHRVAAAGARPVASAFWRRGVAGGFARLAAPRAMKQPARRSPKSARRRGRQRQHRRGDGHRTTHSREKRRISSPQRMKNWPDG